VFINCPFDDGFKELLYAIVFTVYHCGFIPRSSLEEDNALNNRLAKIEQIIENCKYGIHDLSRTESNTSSLPRFNMPFELGLFFGAKRFGDQEQNSKVALVLERQKYLYQQFISDLNGIDMYAHNNDPKKAIKIVRDWLKNSSGESTIAGHVIIIKKYVDFVENIFPQAINNLGLEMNGLTFNDYCLIIETSMKQYTN
jgi:hypothetical protein